LLLFLKQQSSELALVEVGRANLAEVMEFLADDHTRLTGRKVVFLDQNLCTSDSAVPSEASQRQVAIDALWAAGAADIFESPRSLGRLFALAERIANASAEAGRQPQDSQRIADWAWSQLPWQDA
jgi:hypothetical protein